MDLLEGIALYNKKEWLIHYSIDLMLVQLYLIQINADIWIGKRIDINTKEGWQLPQGGIDHQVEPSLDAAVREVYEETGITTVLKILLL